MRKVITISLNGNAFQIEEGGYEALRAYLEAAQSKLREDPDRGEILADLEQAIGEKCTRFLSAHKSVVTCEELGQILQEMGPVDGAAAADAQSAASGEPSAGGAQGSDSGAGATADAAAPKRLYQIHEGAMISGVCKGIAAYFDIDVSIVRLIFVALTIITWGAGILGYIVMMFVIPYASTSEEHAAAHGLPFNAQQLIEQAKRHYASLKDGARWKRQWQRQERRRRREWRAEQRRGRHGMKEQMHWAPPPQHEDVGYAARVLTGVMIPIAALCNAVLIVALFVAIAQFITRGAIFGWVPPPGIPTWVGVLVLFMLYHVCAGPLRAVRHAVYYAHGPSANVWFAMWGSLLWLGFVGVFFWLAYQHWPDLQQLLQQFADSLRNRHVPAPGDSINWSVLSKLWT